MGVYSSMVEKTSWSRKGISGSRARTGVCLIFGKWSSFLPSGALYEAVRADHSLWHAPPLVCALAFINSLQPGCITVGAAAVLRSKLRLGRSATNATTFCTGHLLGCSSSIFFFFFLKKEILPLEIVVCRHMQAVISSGFLDDSRGRDLGFTGRDWEQIVFIQSVYLVSETTPRMWSRCSDRQRGGKTEDQTWILESGIDKQLK